jgi:TonB family protein
MLAIALAAAYSPGTALASDLEEQLKTKYQAQVLTLRRFYEGNKLHFDSGGHLIGNEATGPWTVDGQIHVTEVRLRGQMLQLKGRRRCLFADPSSRQMRDVFEITADDPMSKQFRQFGSKNWREFEKKAQIEVDLDLGSVPQHESEVTSAMNVVFLPPDEELADIVPEYWKGFVLAQERRPPANAPPIDAYRVGKGNGVSAPRAIVAPDPDYSEWARQAGFQGTLILWLIVTPEGGARDIRVAKPLGFGLDERAVQAVSGWRFEPARKDGTTVAVQINVEVTFRLY